MGDNVPVTCPWCYEALELWVDADTEGSMVQDCDVCCRPWQVVVTREPTTGRCFVQLQRA